MKEETGQRKTTDNFGSPNICVTHAHRYVNMNPHIYVHTPHKYLYTHIPAYTYVHMNLHTPVHIYLHTPVHSTYILIHAHTQVHMNLPTYIHTHTT